MKKYCIIPLIAAMFISVSCLRDTNAVCPGSTDVEIEVMIDSGATTRAAADGTEGTEVELGHENERFIKELDVLVFHEDKFLFHREAFKLSSGTKFRIQLSEEEFDKVLDVQIFANCRQILKTWNDGTREGKSWAVLQKTLTDITPGRLVNSATYEYLPMHGMTTGSIGRDNAPNKWGPVTLLRSAASVDVYVQKTDNGVATTATERFSLQSIFAWYAANMGHLATPMPYSSYANHDAPYSIPETMQTSLTASEAVVNNGTIVSGTPFLQAYKPRNFTTAGNINYDGIDYQMYFYEHSFGNGPSSSPVGKRPTRIIIAGKYRTKDAIPAQGATPAVPAEYKDAYYPVDLIYDESDIGFTAGNHRPVVRNTKYEFRIKAVTGPGYPSLPEAAEGATIDLTYEIYKWDKEDVYVGVRGRYNLTMKERSVSLNRTALDTEDVTLFYEINDGFAPNPFTYNFANATNGTQTSITNGIQNDYFKVEVLHTPDTASSSGDNLYGNMKFTVTTLQTYTAGHDKETVVVRFRDVEFKLDITQMPEDWEEGEEIGKDL